MGGEVTEVVDVIVPSHWLVLSGLKRQGGYLVRDGFSLVFSSIDEKYCLASDSKTGSEGPSTGCHLDLRINVDGSTDAQVAGLTQSQDLGGPVSGFVDPEEFYALFGLTVCDDTCNRGYDD